VLSFVLLNTTIKITRPFNLPGHFSRVGVIVFSAQQLRVRTPSMEAMEGVAFFSSSSTSPFPFQGQLRFMGVGGTH
jgi:hypothetical protein